MRTTLDIDQDVLLAVKEMAKQQGVSMGKMLSKLTRQVLTQSVTVTATRNGVPLFPRQPNAGVVTLELVNHLRDEAL